MSDRPLRRKTDFLPETPETVAAQVVQDATKVAQTVITKATETATDLAKVKEETDERMARVLSIALRDVFGENEQAKKFINVSKIPLICASIVSINTNVQKLTDSMDSEKKRLSAVEKYIYMLLGGLVIVGVIVVPLFLNMIKG